METKKYTVWFWTDMVSHEGSVGGSFSINLTENQIACLRRVWEKAGLSLDASLPSFDAVPGPLGRKLLKAAIRAVEIQMFEDMGSDALDGEDQMYNEEHGWPPEDMDEDEADDRYDESPWAQLSAAEQFDYFVKVSDNGFSEYEPDYTIREISFPVEVP